MWWLNPGFWLIVTLIVVLLLIREADLLRWQMVRGLFWRPKPAVPEKQTIVIIDPMLRPPEKNLIINPAYCLADYIMQLADVNIDIIHYPEADTTRVMRQGPICVLISGLTALWTEYKLQDLEAVFGFLEETSLPVLGICGGHQVIGRAFGVPVAPMDRWELGYSKVDLLAEDPLLENLQSPITIFNVHHEEIKEMPSGFDLIGSTELCPIQIIRHREKEIYGVQFHPELSGRQAEGKNLLINFLGRAGVTLRNPGAKQ